MTPQLSCKNFLRAMRPERLVEQKGVNYAVAGRTKIQTLAAMNVGLKRPQKNCNCAFDDSCLAGKAVSLFSKTILTNSSNGEG